MLVSGLHSSKVGDLRVSKDPSIKRVDRASNFEPFTPSFGDGEEIPSEAVERMHAAMWGEAVAFDWEVRHMSARLVQFGRERHIGSFARR